LRDTIAGIEGAAEFADLFCNISDFRIDWPAIAAARGSRVSPINLSRAGPLTLGRAIIAWYTRDGRPIWPEKGASAVTPYQAAMLDFDHLLMSKPKILSYIELGQFDWTLPAYDVGRGYLLLDGAHRSIAALRANAEYNIRLAVIHGPIDHRVLTDLIVFERPS
jgi:hypothetical protein